MKATMEGKTDQAKADLARLAIIRKQREDAARKRQVEVDGVPFDSIKLSRNAHLVHAAKSKPSGSKGDSLSAGKALITKSLGK